MQPKIVVGSLFLFFALIGIRVSRIRELIRGQVIDKKTLLTLIFCLRSD